MKLIQVRLIYIKKLVLKSWFSQTLLWRKQLYFNEFYNIKRRLI